MPRRLRCQYDTLQELILSASLFYHRIPTMPKPAPRDQFVTTTTIVIVALLLLSFGVFGLYWQGLRHVDESVSYAIVGPLTISTEAYSMAARVAVQTSKDNADWARKNQAALRRIIEIELAAVNPQKVHAPGGLLMLQHILKEAAIRDLRTDKIEQMLFTDFILQTDV